MQLCVTVMRRFHSQTIFQYARGVAFAQWVTYGTDYCQGVYRNSLSKASSILPISFKWRLHACPSMALEIVVVCSVLLVDFRSIKQFLGQTRAPDMSRWRYVPSRKREE